MQTATVTAIAERPRVLWLAVAEGRGHLMRATLARELLSEAGIAVDIATTSTAGAEFVAALGARASVLSSKFHLVYDGRQNLARTRTRLVAMRYLASPSGCANDLAAIAEQARSASVIVNDSFHPALMASVLAGSSIGRRVVHVHCENTRLAIEATGGHGPLALLVRAAMTKARRVEIVLAGDVDGEPDAGGTVRLPALVAMPRPRAVVRGERGVRPGERFAVVYLNPYFRDAELASSIEDTLREAGYRMHAVAERFGDRPGWTARDPRLADAVAAADLFVSAPGAAAVTMARTFGVPMIAVATDQPEQAQNMNVVTAISSSHRSAMLRGPAEPDLAAVTAGDGFRDRLRTAIAASAARPTPLDRHRDVVDSTLLRTRALWLRTFTNLIEQSKGSHP